MRNIKTKNIEEGSFDACFWSLVGILYRWLLHALLVAGLVWGWQLFTAEDVRALSFKDSVFSEELTFGKELSKRLDSFRHEDPMDKLAYAVAMHETKDCTLGWGATHNNCMGVRKWNGTALVPARYESKEAAYEDFKEIWGRMYGTTVPTKANAIRWSGNDRATAWLNNVTFYLN